ncbi:flavodoxin family protein [Methanosphaera cuniculi]|uniref:flavodoxin family protein n=1 Tax=Methanosphaera cuniculi TaxID=1077256 RepID=UPI0026ED8DE4|nr:flavodoxin family protein [Methanosphaera cuniculi]
MKILGINTSPRPESNSKIALQAAIDEAEAKGANVKIIDTNKMKISPCHADNACKANGGKCVIDDEMQEIYAAINEADGVIISTPIYWADVSAQLKLIIDRMYSYYMMPSADQLKGKKIGIITSQGAPGEETFVDARVTALKCFESLGFEIVADEAFTENNEPGAIKDKADDLKRAKAMGDKIVE